MDFLPLRVQNIFNSLFQPQTQPQLNPAEMPPQTDPIMDLLKPNNEANNRLAELLNSQPKREDYKPSMMTNIMSRLGGLSASGPAGQANGQMIGYRGMGAEGQKMIDAGLNRGYDQATEEWNAKLKPINDLAQSEKAQNSNNRMIASTIINDRNKDADREFKEAKAKADDETKRESIAQRDRYLAYKYWEAQHPDGKVQSDKDGKLFLVNPQTGKVDYLTDDNGQFITESDLPEQKKLEIQHNNRLGEIAATGSEARKTAVTRGEESRKTVTAQGEKEVKVDNAKTPNRIKVKTTTPGKNTTPTGSSTGSSRRIKVISPDGKTGTIPADQLDKALKSGYKQVP